MFDAAEAVVAEGPFIVEALEATVADDPEALCAGIEAPVDWEPEAAVAFGAETVTDIVTCWGTAAPVVT